MSIKYGDYVLATKWNDGDAGDHWGVGFYAGETDHTPPRHLVNYGDGTTIRSNGFRKVIKVPPSIGIKLLRDPPSEDSGLSIYAIVAPMLADYIDETLGR